MNKITNLKEAFKTGLAFAMVFGIALQAGWMNPYWAGWAVAVVALPTAGASIQKGIRVFGTIPGCLAALVIHALAAQDRWVFMLLTCAWMFFTTYMMVRREKDSYFWVMAGYVCLVILLSDLDSSANMFESAVFRTVETAMGVAVYTLIAVFLSPQTNLRAIKPALIGYDLGRYLPLRSRHLLRQPTHEASYQVLHGKVVERLAQFGQILQAERLRRAMRSMRFAISGSASTHCLRHCLRLQVDGSPALPNLLTLTCGRSFPNCNHFLLK